MTTLTIQVENNSVLLGLKRIIKVMEGVSIVSNKRNADAQGRQLNASTIKAINDVRAGKTYKASSADDLLAQCLD